MSCILAVDPSLHTSRQTFLAEYAAATEGALNYLLAILLILLQLLACDKDHDATFDNDPWYMRRIDRLLYS